jgi:hypothetical protein
MQATDNNAPKISGDPQQLAIMSEAYEFTPSSSDADGDALTFTIRNQPPWAAFDAVTGRLQGIPQLGDVGTYEDIVISVSDGLMTASLPAFSIKVRSDQNAPKISGDPQQLAIKSQEYAFTPSSSDADGDPLTFTIQNQPAWAAFDEATGHLQGIPQSGDVGSYEDIVISVSDGLMTVSLPAFSIKVSKDGLGSVTLEWLPPQSNTDGSYAGDLAGYVIYWGTEPGNYDQQVRIDNVGLTAYVVDSLPPATYYFTATAFNSAGIESDYSNEVVRSVVFN